MSPVVIPSDSKWIAYRRHRPEAALRLLCFHYAGGGASAFRDWSDRLPAFVDVCPVQLPGRENRLKEKLPDDVVRLVEDLRQALPLQDMPFVFFGHSMGSLIAYELACALRRAGAMGPHAVLLAGRRAPQYPSHRSTSLSSLPRASLVSELKKLNGLPAELLAHDEFLDYYLRIIRADFALVDSADGRVHPPLACELRTYAGEFDPEASAESMTMWRELIQGRYQHASFEGDHFFIHSCKEALLSRLSADLEEIMEHGYGSGR